MVGISFYLMFRLAQRMVESNPRYWEPNDLLGNMSLEDAYELLKKNSPLVILAL